MLHRVRYAEGGTAVLDYWKINDMEIVAIVPIKTPHQTEG